MPTNERLENSVSIRHPLSTNVNTTTDNGQQTTDSKQWLSVDFERLDYRKAWSLQKELITARRAGSLQNDVLLFLEHPPVFTLGRRGGRECMLVTEAFREKTGIPIIQVERGGTITYHGPGQLVGYPILPLGNTGTLEYLRKLEKSLIQTLAFFDGLVRSGGIDFK